ncbi:cation diffusion facilitator family transporter [Breoghania sp.]|uniref:cation diffusion facilitator family transporter n=1 Tax=Breoghania sp. TaxID=2065378 RepID=UPI0032046E8D
MHDHCSGHAHSHGHGHHHHVDPNAGDLRIAFAIGINFLLTVVQIIGGVMARSLALIADALHNFSDSISLVIAFGARKIARRPSDAQMTFGYDRIEIVAALINYTGLIIVGLYLVYEAMLRFIQSEVVDGWLVIIIAAVALVIDLGTALLTFTMSKTSVNIRAAFLHNVADALGSVAVIFAGTLILLYDWRLIDPIVTLMIAGYILWQSFVEIGPVIRILMLGSPPHIAAESVLETLRAVDGVADIHHVHLWQMNEHQNAVDAHLVIADGCWTRADEIKAAAKARLMQEFDVSHTTLEMECTHHACSQPRTIGH